MTITVFDLKGYSFRARGDAGNIYYVLSANPKYSTVQRVQDGLKYEIETHKLLDQVNSRFYNLSLI